MASTELRLWNDGSAGDLAVPGGELVLELAELEERARSYEANSKSANTWRAYQSDLRHFGAWCEGRDLVALPAEPSLTPCGCTWSTMPAL